MESGIQLEESGIPLTVGIQNPSSTTKTGIQYLESGIQNLRLSWMPLHGAISVSSAEFFQGDPHKHSY